MTFLALFFAGALLCNCLPHLASGLGGRPFPSPFAQPPGVGDSAPIVNFYWGFGNLVAGVVLLARNPVAVGLNGGFLILLVGALAIGTHLSLHFGKVRRSKSSRR